ncbi:MAG: hypothetical protein ACJ751_08630 [Niastella sp.]|jgi:hypothetical protein|uniref:hypothetical protein n=1 Tax=Niastella sp. TaxID=1869183 RepID=UPI00389A4959
MPKSLPLAVIPLLFCVSCASTTFQYSTLSSSDVKKNDRNEFMVENDSLRLVYNFSGKSGPIHISIENKMGVPVYIDWKRSAMIVNNKAIPYVVEEMKIEGNFQGSSYNYRNSGYGVNSGQLQATAVLPPTLDFIPPRAIINKNQMYVTNGFNGRIPDTAFHKLKYPVAEGVTVKVKKATFTEATSPFRFRSYITYMIGEPGTKPFAFEHSFFVSEIMNTGSGPKEMSINTSNRGDQYYTIRY